MNKSEILINPFASLLDPLSVLDNLNPARKGTIHSPLGLGRARYISNADALQRRGREERVPVEEFLALGKSICQNRDITRKDLYQLLPDEVRTTLTLTTFQTYFSSTIQKTVGKRLFDAMKEIDAKQEPVAQHPVEENNSCGTVDSAEEAVEDTLAAQIDLFPLINELESIMLQFEVSARDVYDRMPMDTKENLPFNRVAGWFGKKTATADKRELAAFMEATISALEV